MNLFEFYRDSVQEWQRASNPGWKLSKEHEDHLTQTVIPQFRDDCFKPDRLDYSEEDRQIAYALHFAPKHAVIWREYLRHQPKSHLHSVTRLNSIGTGPGSELIGIIEGASRLSPAIEIVCLERQSRWRALLDVVLARYQAEKGICLTWMFTNDPQHLINGAPVVGSCVLSELGRERKINSFLSVMNEQVGGVRARFLDFPSYPTSNGKKYIVDRIPDCNFISLYEQEMNLCNTLNDEMGACQPCQCEVRQTKEPGLRMHLFRFK